MENKNLISYSTFLQYMLNLQKAGTRSGSDFNYTDTPSHSYFKLLFYFHNNDTNETAGGLLAPTWQVATGNYYMYNSAWAYLMQNGEHERAEKLEQFITLLSDIKLRYAKQTSKTADGNHHGSGRSSIASSQPETQGPSLLICL